jgi:hypothetical protein
MTEQGQPSRTGLRVLTSVDALHLLVFLVILGVSPLAVMRTDAGWWLPVGYAALAGAVVALARAHAARPASLPLEIVHLAYPVVAVFLIFWSLYWIVPGVNPHGFRDDLLIRWDREILGVDAVSWFRQWERPWLTDLMHAVYMIYFALPVVLVLALVRMKRRERLTETIFVLCLSFYLCYVGYGIIPAQGPRGAIYGSNVMEGVFITQLCRDLIDFLEPNKADVFPSAYAAVTIVVNGLAFRHARRLGWWMLPLSAGIVSSLVYTRYHYVIDVLAGVLWAAVTLAIGPLLHGWWEKRVRRG